MASDRRLVSLQPDGSLRLRDDDRNKAVLFGNRIVFAYTGFAQLGPRRQPTDEWLAHTLHESREVGDHSKLLEAVRDATAARLSHPLYRRSPPHLGGHEFVGCGWARFPSSGMREFRPYIAFVTNLRGPSGDLLSQPADQCSFLWGELPPDQPGGVWISGQQLEAAQHTALLNDIGAAAPDLGAIASVLVDYVRIAAADNRAIGRGVLLNSLPRGAIREGDPGVMLIMGGPMEDTPTCFYVSADNNELRQYGPIVVSPFGGIMSGFTAGPPESFPDISPA